MSFVRCAVAITVALSTEFIAIRTSITAKLHKMPGSIHQINNPRQVFEDQQGNSVFKQCNGVIGAGLCNMMQLECQAQLQQDYRMQTYAEYMLPHVHVLTVHTYNNQLCRI
jgi:hypothetical protein